MALKIQDFQFSHVIAIDFGTGASGYGICARQIDQNEQLRIEVFNPCDENDDQKTPTAILFDDENNFLDFGSNAIQKYAQMIDDGETAKLFMNYKMSLLHLEKNAKSLDGRELCLQKVISESLKFISDKALEKLQEQIGQVQKQKIRWVITVPALWEEQHKQFMRNAAMQAELVTKDNEQNLLLCLEPEGASIQCREDSEDIIKQQMVKGSVIMVLDCGGGTVDITIHKLECEPNERFLCNELIPSSGGSEWGSKYVDANYEQFLEQFLGQELSIEYNKNSVSRLDMLKDFEIIKRKFKGSDRSMAKFNYLGDFLSTQKLKSLIEEFNKKNEHQLKLKGSSNVELPAALVQSFFTDLFDKIKNKVQNLIDEVRQKNEKVDYIFLVGGFSENNYLKSEIKSLFEQQGIQILVPRRPQISVIRGACMYGLNPRSIQSRIAKLTYGINTLVTFDPKKYPKEKKVTVDGEDFCEDIFDAFVRKGESVSIDEVHTKIYCPVRTKQTFMRIMFYSTEEKDVLFIDDKGVSQLAELQIDIGQQNQTVEEKTVRVTLKFGSTHIFVKATNQSGNVIKESQFNFESS